MPRLVAVLVVLLALTLVAPAVAFAQEATPGTGAEQFPLTPDPAECQVEPRDVEEFVGIAAEATPTVGMTGTGTVEIPVGELADAETVAAVTAVTREIYACFNAGDFRRAFSLLTDEAVLGFAEEEPIPEAELRGLLGATPEAVPAEGRTTILAVTDVVRLADGRVGALVASADPADPEEGPTAVHLTFEQADGRWLVDGVVEFHTHPEEEDEGTPTP